MIYLGATNYPTTSGSIGENLYLYLSLNVHINNFHSVMMGGSLTVQEDYATNIFPL